MLLIFDYHIHSYYSHDSLNDPKDILKVALKQKINAISITDHNTIAGSLALKKIAKDKEILVITGIEMNTSHGDLVILGLKEEIKTKDFLEVLDIAKSEGYVSILPHPYVRHNISSLYKELSKKLDAIEIYNARAPRFFNKRAERLAMVLNKPTTAGSDAHLLAEIGNGLNFILVSEMNEENLIKEIKKGKIKILGKPSNPIYRIFSGIIQIPKSFKREYI